MRAELREAAKDAIGFMPEDEGLALYEAGLDGARTGPLLEVGGYCGKSAVYLGAAARERNTILYSIDHHRGSEEHQIGEEYHDPRLLDADGSRIDTLPVFRATIASAGLEEAVVAVVGWSGTIAANWSTPLGLAFIDGGHSEEAARTDYEGWAPTSPSEDCSRSTTSSRIRRKAARRRATSTSAPCRRGGSRRP